MGFTQSKQWRIELLYRYKQAKTSRITVLNIRKLYLYFFTLKTVCLLWVEPASPFEKWCARTTRKLAYLFIVYTISANTEIVYDKHLYFCQTITMYKPSFYFLINIYVIRSSWYTTVYNTVYSFYSVLTLVRRRYRQTYKDTKLIHVCIACEFFTQRLFL